MPGQRAPRAFRASGRWAVAVDWSVTFHFVCVSWIFFRSPSLDVSTQYLAGIWTDNGAATTMPWIVAPLLAAGAVTHLIPPTRAASAHGSIGAACRRRSLSAPPRFTSSW